MDTIVANAKTASATTPPYDQKKGHNMTTIAAELSTQAEEYRWYEDLVEEVRALSHRINQASMAEVSPHRQAMLRELATKASVIIGGPTCDDDEPVEPMAGSLAGLRTLLRQLAVEIRSARERVHGVCAYQDVLDGLYLQTVALAHLDTELLR